MLWKRLLAETESRDCVVSKVVQICLIQSLSIPSFCVCLFTLCLTLIYQLFKPQAKDTLTLGNATFTLVLSKASDDVLQICATKYHGFLKRMHESTMFFNMYNGTVFFIFNHGSSMFLSMYCGILGSTLENHEF